MYKKFFIFFILAIIVQVSDSQRPKKCTVGNKSGYCVHQKQCRGRKSIQAVECRSSTGLKLYCCIGFRPKTSELKYDGVCGQRALIKLHPRKEEMKTEAIVGGYETWPGKWPWMSAVFEGQNYVCGGTLISSKCVLTAAHCFDGQENRPKKFFVRLGDHNLYTDTDNEFPQEIQAEKVYVHPKFKVNCSDDDLAIIQLSQSSQRTPACLPKKSKAHNLVGSNVMVVGWGTVRYDSKNMEPFSPVLREITIPVQQTSFCEEHYKTIGDYEKSFKHGIVNERFICAGVEDGSKDACLGDSGGPLVEESAPNQWTLRGVVCIGYGCGMRGYPGIYTRVSNYIDWIAKYC